MNTRLLVTICGSLAAFASCANDVPDHYAKLKAAANAVPGLEACKGVDVCQQEWSAAYAIRQAAKAAKRS